MFSHEKFKPYRLAVRFVGEVESVINHIPKGHADLIDQLRRASISISLNIAEGSGRLSQADRRKFYAIARASGLECAAILDTLNVLGIGENESIAMLKGILKEIVAILSSVIFKKRSGGEGRDQDQAQD